MTLTKFQETILCKGIAQLIKDHPNPSISLLSYHLGEFGFRVVPSQNQDTNQIAIPPYEDYPGQILTIPSNVTDVKKYLMSERGLPAKPAGAAFFI